MEYPDGRLSLLLQWLGIYGQGQCGQTRQRLYLDAHGGGSQSECDLGWGVESWQREFAKSAGNRQMYDHGSQSDQQFLSMSVKVEKFGEPGLETPWVKIGRKALILALQNLS